MTVILGILAALTVAIGMYFLAIASDNLLRLSADRSARWSDIITNAKILAGAVCIFVTGVHSSIAVWF